MRRLHLDPPQQGVRLLYLVETDYDLPRQTLVGRLRHYGKGGRGGWYVTYEAYQEGHAVRDGEWAVGITLEDAMAHLRREFNAS